ncbi:integral membrane protein GPR137B, partial [Camelus ferus]
MFLKSSRLPGEVGPSAQGVELLQSARWLGKAATAMDTPRSAFAFSESVPWLEPGLALRLASGEEPETPRTPRSFLCPTPFSRPLEDRVYLPCLQIAPMITFCHLWSFAPAWCPLKLRVPEDDTGPSPALGSSSRSTLYLDPAQGKGTNCVTRRVAGGCVQRPCPARQGAVTYPRLNTRTFWSPEPSAARFPLYLASLLISLIFLLVNLTCAVLVKTGHWERKVIVSVRVAINDTLFVLCAVSLSVCLYKISKMSLANIYLESKGSSVCQVTAVGVTVILLYASRACYNLFTLSFSQSRNVRSFDYDWYNVSDQADLRNQLGDAGYVVFGVVLFVWELLPTTLVVFFFRVRSPAKDLTNPGMVPSHGFSPRSYFFDNPRRYDSDDDLAWNVAPQGLQG